MKYLCAILLFAAVLAGTAHPAAATVYWSSIATACTPDSSSIQNDRYMSTVDAYVAARTGKVDPIVLVCAVTPNFGAETPALFLMSYLDSTGTALTASVQAQFIRVNRVSGGRVVIASLNSNNSADTSATIITAIFNHVLNFNSFYYYVRIVMDRSATSQNIRAIGVALQTNDPV